MIDYYNFTNLDNNNFVFSFIGTSIWQTWQKPRGCKLLQFFVIGGGGGGGAGGSGALNTSRSGGAGGGSSGVSRCLVPASCVPDTLYILVGNGGIGGTATGAIGNAGSSGGLSYVSVEPNTTSINVLLASGNAAAGGGNGGANASSNATAGSAGTIYTITNGLLGYLAHTNFIAGQIGTGGGNINQSGTTNTLTGITSGGAGAAGVSTVNRNGASITGAGFVPTINGGNVTTLSQANSGFHSFSERSNSLRLPLFFTGGAGGYSINTTTGGTGGNGAYGCGGGGGGAGLTGGSGGNGGNGLVIITCC